MIPDYNNFYAAFYGVTKADVRNAFVKNNWSCTKESWFDFEITNDWAELVLFGDESEPLISGAVDYNNSNVEAFDRLFNLLAGSFVYEFYDNNGALLFEKRK